MHAYIVRRLSLIIPTLLAVTITVFFTSRVIPGGVVDLMVQRALSQGMGDVDPEALRRMMGLDLPIHVQYGRWAAGLIHGNLGESLWTGVPVAEVIIQRLPVSMELGVLAIFVAMLIALPVGVYSAIRQDSVGDYLGRSLAIACIALPSFWLATMVMVFPSIWWRWSPPLEYVSLSSNPLRNLQMMWIPALILGMTLSGTTMRMTRTMMLEVLRQDYIRTAWAKGLNEKVIIVRHALKNAMMPVITIVGLMIPVVIGGSVILEQIFVLPGIGRLLVETINKRDYPLLSGINLLMASFVLFINIVVDLVYAYLDPRVRYR